MLKNARSILNAAPQLPRYGAVSALALAVDLVCYAGLIESGVRASLAGAVGYVIGLLLHYALSRRFVFDATVTAKSNARLFTEFAAAGAIGVAITAAIIAAATEVLTLHPIIAKGIAVALSFLAVYLLRKTIVFAEPTPALEASSRNG